MKLFYTFLVLCIVQTGVFAYDWAAHDVTVVKTIEEDEVTSLLLKDGAGNQFSVQFRSDPDGETAKKIIKIKNDFFAWKSISIETIKFAISKKSVDVAVFPKKFEYKTVDVMKYLPAGLFFSYRDIVEYNFRITKDNLLVRVKGPYSKEEEMCDKIAEALKDPLAFIRKRDPEYFLEQLVKLEEKTKRLEEKNKQLNDQLENQRYATLMLHNKGFFGGFNIVPRTTIDRVLAVKKTNPVLTNDEIRKQLEKEKIEVSSKEIELIFNIYLNQFSK